MLYSYYRKPCSYMHVIYNCFVLISLGVLAEFGKRLLASSCLSVRPFFLKDQLVFNLTVYQDI